MKGDFPAMDGHVCEGRDVALIAGRLTLAEVMDELATDRPVFHSEADFQFAFAQAIVRAAPDVAIRLEARQSGDRAEYVDLVARGTESTFIEFKYATATWAGTDGLTDEPFALRDHAAMDLTRLHFLHDVWRLERFVGDRPGANGFAVLLTNVSSLWEHPRGGPTRDAKFRIHNGACLTGNLVWGEGDYPRNDRSLRGTYHSSWNHYATLPGRRGEFRWLGWEVEPAL